jgi:hypothetical protein
MKKLNNTEWSELDVTKGTFYNRNTSNSIYLVDSATEPANANDAVVLHPGEKKYLESTSGKIYAKTVRGEAELATSGFSSSNAVLRDKIQNLSQNLEGIKVLTQAEYDALGTEVETGDVLYIING